VVSNRRSEERDFKRRKAKRDPKFRILVVCEGLVTEPEYIRAFQHHVKNPRVHVALPKTSGAPITVVETAQALAAEASARAKRERDENLKFDSVWAVVDVDSHLSLDQALLLAESNHINVALSNPCFELWALLHLADQRAHVERHVLASLLRDRFPAYAKLLPFESLIDGYDQAVARATSLEQAGAHHGDPRRNPSTAVYKLTELIRTQ
jgi:hypothetical protein